MNHMPYRYFLTLLRSLLACLFFLVCLSCAYTEPPAVTLATSAVLSTPCSVTIDRTGIVYFADEVAGLIRKVDPSTGRISTMAGGGTETAGGCLATTAKLERPTGIALDAEGNLYIAEFLNKPLMGRLRRVDASTGTISTIAAGVKPQSITGPGLAMTTHIEAPWSLVVDAQGNLILLDPPHNILRIDPRNGRVQLLAHHPSTEDKDLPTIVALTVLESAVHPTALALDRAGKLYFMGTNNHIYNMDTATGVVTHIAGAEKNATNTLTGANTLPALTANFPTIAGMALDAQHNLYLTSSLAHHIYKITNSTGLASIVAGAEWAAGDNVAPPGSQVTGPATQVSLPSPYGIAVDEHGQLYFTDTLSSTLRKLDLSSNQISIFAGNPRQ